MYSPCFIFSKFQEKVFSITETAVRIHLEIGKVKKKVSYAYPSSCFLSLKYLKYFRTLLRNLKKKKKKNKSIYEISHKEGGLKRKIL